MINKIYNQEEIQKQMKNFLEENGFLQLENFFSTIPKYNLKNKKIIYSPLFEKKTQFNINLQEEIIIFIENLLNRKIKEINYNEYKHKSFILINDENKLENEYEIIIDLTKKWNPNSGGILTYTTKEEEVFYIKPSYNTLTIIKTNKKLRKYLKYINNKSNNDQINRIEINC